MLNKYPLWKYLLVLVVIVMGVVYALPNLYGDDEAIQVTANRSAEVNPATRDQVIELLDEAGLSYKSYELKPDSLTVRFSDSETQLKAMDRVQVALGNKYSVALNLAPTTPQWLQDFNAMPMYLGLDLRGGVHFLLEVDMDEAVVNSMKSYEGDVRTTLREGKVPPPSRMELDNIQLNIAFRDAETRDKAYDAISSAIRKLVLSTFEDGGMYSITATLSEQEIMAVKKAALKQNITALRKRVNELGVAEPVIQQQGENRIVVQLPGIQDTTTAKGIIGKTATLEYHLADVEGDLSRALAGRVPPGSRIYRDRDGRPHLLLKRTIVTGEHVTHAASGLDPDSGTPMVSVRLNSQGASKMLKTTTHNVDRPMAVVYIEDQPVYEFIDGKKVKVRDNKVEDVISVANIREPFGPQFQTTGLDSVKEAHELALLLRAGALAAPMHIVEERTIGPALGAESIAKGINSVIYGFVFVLAFMAFWYRGFGMVANVALALNLVVIVAVLSMLQATLTLPGIAGIVLTVGMAVDANVLIFERIREELRAGSPPQQAIHAGYEKAFSTIADANITTFIAAVVLYAFGTGPIQGFAITLSIGIATSMFTAIVVSRAIVNLAVGGKRIKSLSI